ncbi:DNA primase TraC [Methylococcales bacterium]|nr:DNA primase TraC [Methylococcales bacterium]
MADSKTYLNVPYAQKDAAKALGARWDAARKKWYAPSGVDIALFVQWQHDNTALQAIPAPANQPVAVAPSNLSGNTSSGVFTYPTIKDFVAYDGNQAPWD